MKVLLCEYLQEKKEKSYL